MLHANLHKSALRVVGDCKSTLQLYTMCNSQYVRFLRSAGLRKRTINKCRSNNQAFRAEPRAGMPFRHRKHYIQLMFQVRISSRLCLNMNTHTCSFEHRYFIFLDKRVYYQKDSLTNPSKRVDGCKPVYLFSLFLNTINLRERSYGVTERRLPPSQCTYPLG